MTDQAGPVGTNTWRRPDAAVNGGRAVAQVVDRLTFALLQRRDLCELDGCCAMICVGNRGVVSKYFAGQAAGCQRLDIHRQDRGVETS